MKVDLVFIWLRCQALDYRPGKTIQHCKLGFSQCVPPVILPGSFGAGIFALCSFCHIDHDNARSCPYIEYTNREVKKETAISKAAIGSSVRQDISPAESMALTCRIETTDNKCSTGLSRRKVRIVQVLGSRISGDGESKMMFWGSKISILMENLTEEQREKVSPCRTEDDCVWQRCHRCSVRGVRGRRCCVYLALGRSLKPSPLARACLEVRRYRGAG